MERTIEIGARERNGKGEAEARLVQLVDRNDHEGTGLGLLSASRRIRVCPVNVSLLGLWLYHSGAGASKPDPISALSAR